MKEYEFIDTSFNNYDEYWDEDDVFETEYSESEECSEYYDEKIVFNEPNIEYVCNDVKTNDNFKVKLYYFPNNNPEELSKKISFFSFSKFEASVALDLDNINTKYIFEYVDTMFNGRDTKKKKYFRRIGNYR